MIISMQFITKGVIYQTKFTDCKIMFMKQPILKFLASGFGSGFFPYAPGTFASFCFLPIGFLINGIAGPLGSLIMSLFLCFFSWVVVAFVVKDTKESDPSWIVLDEFAGQNIALFLSGTSIVLCLLSFVLFRLFDIFKPWPISFFDRQFSQNHWLSSFYILADDVLAGLFTLLIIYAVFFLF